LENLCIDCQNCIIRDFEEFPVTRNELRLGGIRMPGLAACRVFPEENFCINEHDLFLEPEYCEDFRQVLPDHIKLWEKKLNGKK